MTALAPRLSPRFASAGAAGRLPQEAIDEVVAYGIMRLAVRARYGGLELR